MKTIQKISALLAASATLSMAGVINVYTGDAKKASASLNLTTIDSLTFSGKAEKKEMNFSGKTKQKAIKLSDMDHMDFKLKDKSKETMTVTVSEGIMEGTHTFNLSEIKKIEIVKMDSEEDMDSDGLTDLEEIYKYDTNPKAADTDGDGWSDKEELADGMYSPSNPTKFNPRIADVPGLMVTLKKSPTITLNIETSEGTSSSKTITEGSEVTNTRSTSYEQTRSADIMNAWEFSTTHGIEVEGKFSPNLTKSGIKYTGSVTLGYNGSYTSSTGMSWGSSEEKSVAESYEKAVSEEMSKGSTVNGAKLCMQVELKNTSDIAFTIEALRLSASTYDVKDTSSLKILADLDREGSWADIQLKPGKSEQAKFCNENVAVKDIEDLIYNTSSIVLGSSTQKITSDGGSFDKIYTTVAAKTADITIDYGPGSAGNSSARYQVATNYRYNPDNKGSDDMYAKTSLADLLRNAHVNFEQDSVVGPEKKKVYGLASIDGYKFNLADSAMWYVTIQSAANIKKGLNTLDMYSFFGGSYDMEHIFVGAGDAVHIFYSKDQDHDGVPLPTEYLFGTDDKKKDTDGDGLSDYDEIVGWTKGESTVKIYTSPTDPDTDGDGLNDKEDPEPTRRPMFTDASLSMLQVFADSLMVDSTALLSKDSTELAKGRSFDAAIQAPVAFIKVKPKAKKVSWVRFTATTNMATKQYVTPDADGFYSFQTPGKLTISKNSSVKIEVRSEDGTDSTTYTLSISSTLRAPTDLQLGKDKNRKIITVNYNYPVIDTARLEGFVILRGYKGDKLPDTIANNTPISNEGTYNGFTVFDVKGKSISSYPDNVGAGSPYFAYRVYAYTLEGDSTNKTMVFSKGSEQHERSVGRIELTFKMDDFGSEFLHCGSLRCDFTANVSLHAGSSAEARKLASWEGYDWKGGIYPEYRVVFLSEEFDDGKDEDRKPNYNKGTTEVDSLGLYLYFNVKADKNGVYYYAKQGIHWPYAQMATVLSGDASSATGENGKAPKQGKQMKFLVGQKGIEYDVANDKCGETCGDDPHTGYKFTFSYKWVGDNDFY